MLNTVDPIGRGELSCMPVSVVQSLYMYPSFVGFTQLEDLFSSVSRLLDVSTAVDLASPSVMAEAQRLLLELLSEQDGCLIEGLTLSCRITKSIKKMYDHCLFLSIRLSPKALLSLLYVPMLCT